MGKCAVCGEECNKWFLFLPSKVLLYLCTYHFSRRVNETKPVLKWVEDEKKGMEVT